ncbi:hypothetical protein ABT322_34315 [Streptomyces flaveolus]|uniref:Uncharacterized protein n=1 Tax=Streptomyces flaveolus TaxID=67297 RepID=A0ABV1VQE4_9ACTN
MSTGKDVDWKNIEIFTSKLMARACAPVQGRRRPGRERRGALHDS